jgi:hypothetical protein
MRTIISTVVLIVCLSACTEKDGINDAEACKHLKGGPAAAVIASMGTLEAPIIAADYRRYDITLVGSPGDKGGAVRFTADESGDFTFFFSADVHVRFGDKNGMTISPESRTTSSPACAEIKTKYIVPLNAGFTTLNVALGPDEKVSVVVGNAEHMHSDSRPPG